MIVQGGGPTQVLNATLSAIVDEAQQAHGFDHVIGACSGTRGLAEGKFVDLGRLAKSDLDLLRASPGAALGSSRYGPSGEDMERILNNLKSNNVHEMLFVGGNGTMLGAQKVLRYCHESGWPLRAIGVPKTIDNDVARTDRCPGYGSAARYIAQSTRDLGMDIRSLPQPVSILETMGRSVGWIAAAAAAGKRDEEDAPHLVYIPEIAFDLDRFIEAVDAVVSELGWAVVVVSEGIRDAGGQPVYQISDSAQADPLNRPFTGGVGQFLADQVAARLRIRCRCEKPGLLGRSSMLHRSSRDVEDAELVGRAAVRGLLSGRSGEMISLLPLVEGHAGYEFVELESVAGVERFMPAGWVRSDDTPIPLDERFFEYIRPLIGELESYHLPIFSDLTFAGSSGKCKAVANRVLSCL